MAVGFPSSASVVAAPFTHFHLSTSFVATALSLMVSLDLPERIGSLQPALGAAVHPG